MFARIERRSREFAAACPEGSQKRTAAEQRARLRPAPITDSSDEAYDEAYCPACGLRGWVLGYEWDREVIDEQYEQEGYGYFLTVLVRYGAERFRCEECDLILEGHDEIEIVDMPTDFEREQEEEPDYEAEYGND